MCKTSHLLGANVFISIIFSLKYLDDIWLFKKSFYDNYIQTDAKCVLGGSGHGVVVQSIEIKRRDEIFLTHPLSWGYSICFKTTAFT